MLHRCFASLLRASARNPRNRHRGRLTRFSGHSELWSFRRKLFTTRFKRLVLTWRARPHLRTHADSYAASFLSAHSYFHRFSALLHYRGHKEYINSLTLQSNITHKSQQISENIALINKVVTEVLQVSDVELPLGRLPL